MMERYNYPPLRKEQEQNNYTPNFPPVFINRSEEKDDDIEVRTYITFANERLDGLSSVIGELSTILRVLRDSLNSLEETIERNETH